MHAHRQIKYIHTWDLLEDYAAHELLKSLCIEAWSVH